MLIASQVYVKLLERDIPAINGKAKIFDGSQNASFCRMNPQLPKEDFILDLPVLGVWRWQSQNHEPERGKRISFKIIDSSWFYCFVFVLFSVLVLKFPCSRNTISSGHVKTISIPIYHHLEINLKTIILKHLRITSTKMTANKINNQHSN